MILDAGVFALAERNPRRLAALLRRFPNEPLRTNEAVMAQVWRNPSRQALLARFGATCEIEALAEGRAIGALLAQAGSNDVVDGSVALMGLAYGEPVLTGDPDDIGSLGATTVSLVP